jgi:hypothetical protein
MKKREPFSDEALERDQRVSDALEAAHKRSMRRDRENQRQSERLERATPIWTRSADLHTGPRRVNSRIMRPDTRQHLTSRQTFRKPLASFGASTHD